MQRRVLNKKLRRSPYSLFESVEHQAAPRVLLVEFFHWPFMDARLEDADPLAVLTERGVVLHVSLRAMRKGIKPGDKVRHSLALAPGLKIIRSDVLDQGVTFSKVANVLEQFSPLVEIVDLGVCATYSKGPSRYFGGDERLISQVRSEMSRELGNMFPAASGKPPDFFENGSVFSFGVSIADGIFTARIAARRSLLVPPGDSGVFLSPLSVKELPDQSTADTLCKLGIGTLGEFASLDYSVVLERFGSKGAVLHRMAAGLDASALELPAAKDDFNQKVELEEPLEAESAVIFACKVGVERMLAKMLEKGYLCQVMRIRLMSGNGEESIRDWGVKDGFSVQLLLERIRWQLESWSGDPRLAPSAGVEIVELEPRRLMPSSRAQLDLDGCEKASVERVSQALARVDAMVGGRPSFARIKDSRTAKGSVEMVPWQLQLFEVEPIGVKAEGKKMNRPPWPGRPLGPAPAICFDPEVEIGLCSKDGIALNLSAEVFLSNEPGFMVMKDSGRWVGILAWSAPWPMAERWWDPQSATRVVRIQILTDSMGALLVKMQDRKWFIEGWYD